MAEERGDGGGDLTLPGASLPSEDWKEWTAFAALFTRHCPVMCESPFTVKHLSGPRQSHEATCTVQGTVGVAHFRLDWNATITEIGCEFSIGGRICTDFEAGRVLRLRGAVLPRGAEANCPTEAILASALRHRDELARLLAPELGKTESADALFCEVEGQRR